MRVLGVSPFHDSSVAIVNDGVLEYFCKEERLTRVKRDKMPFQSIAEAIRTAKGIIDTYVIASPTWSTATNETIEIYLKKITGCKVVERLCDEHHKVHASNAFYNSGFDTAMVFIADRVGSSIELENSQTTFREAESIYLADYPAEFTPLYKSYFLINKGISHDVQNAKLEKILSSHNNCDISASSTMGIVHVYESATSLIGQHPLENGKVMGLAAYGNNKNITPDLFSDNVANDSKFLYCGYTKNKEVLNVNNKKYYTEEVTPENYELYADYALSVQLQTQEVVGNLIEKYIKQTNTKNVVVTGGYGLNVVCNQYLTNRFPKLNFYFEPLADDSGNSIGAANYICRKHTNNSEIIPLTHTFFNHLEPVIPENIGENVTVEKIAEYLKEEKTIAMFNGKAEAGPRALGNRSILFDPRVKKGKDIINNIKKREWYRPFACSVLEEDANEYFDMGNTTKSLFMTSSFNIRPKYKDSFPAITHVDGTCRIQTVDESIPHFIEILKKFKEITGVGMLLNTSFNISGEPLVQSFEDALNTCKKTKIDMLWIPEKAKLIII